MRATFRDWFLLTRPWAGATVMVPFLVGLALVKRLSATPPGVADLVHWAEGFASGLALQAACNLFNTYGDEKSGVDRMPGVFLTTPQIQEGKISLRATFLFGTVCVLVAALLGLPLLWTTAPEGAPLNMPLLAGSLLGFFGALNYSTGVKYKYYGLGVPLVAFFEGFLYVGVVFALLRPAEVGAQLGKLVFFTLPVAALVAVILHGNDMRDIATDRAAGIRTLALRQGPRGALVSFIAMHVFPYLVVGAWLASGGTGAAWRLAPFAVLPWTAGLVVKGVRDYRACPRAPQWLFCEQGSGLVYALFGLALGVAVFLG